MENSEKVISWEKHGTYVWYAWDVGNMHKSGGSSCFAPCGMREIEFVFFCAFLCFYSSRVLKNGITFSLSNSQGKTSVKTEIC